jgi:hypothetical protein
MAIASNSLNPFRFLGNFKPFQQVTLQQDENPVLIPDGKFLGIDDSDIIKPISITRDGKNIEVPLIYQKYAGNCAEYSALNSAIFALALDAANLPIGAELQFALEKARSLRAFTNTFEVNFVIPILSYFNGLSMNQRFGIRQNDATEINLEAKRKNIYSSLEGENAILLFWTMFKGVNGPKLGENYVDYRNSDSALKRISTISNAVILCGDRMNGHQTNIFKYGNQYFSINSMDRQIVRNIDFNTAVRILRQITSTGGYFVINDFAEK